MTFEATLRNKAFW